MKKAKFSSASKVFEASFSRNMHYAKATTWEEKGPWVALWPFQERKNESKVFLISYAQHMLFLNTRGENVM